MKKHNVYTALAVAALLTTSTLTLTVNAADTATTTTTTSATVTKAAAAAAESTKEDIRTATRQVSSLVSTDTAIKTKLPTTADKTRDAIVANKLSQYKATAKDLAKAGSDTDGATITPPTFPWAQTAMTNFTKAGILNDGFTLGEKLTVKEAGTLLANLAKYDAKQNKYSEINTSKLLPSTASQGTVTRSTFAKAVAAFVAQRNVKLNKKVTVPANVAPVTFSDDAELSTDLKTALTTLSTEGIVSYGENVAFRPNDAINGAEAIVMLDRINHPIALPTKVVPTVTTTSSVAAANSMVRKGDEEAAKATATAQAANQANAEGTTHLTTPDKSTLTASTTKTKTTNAVSTSTAAVNPLTGVTPVTDPTEQRNLEDALFTKLNTLYQKPENFQNYGVMYWRDNMLHVALKNGDDLTQLENTIAKDKKNSDYINKHTTFELTQFSQSEYDRIATNFKNFYGKKQPAGQILDMYPDVPHNQLIANVTKSFDYMQDSIQSAFGTKVRVFVIAPANA